MFSLVFVGIDSVEVSWAKKIKYSFDSVLTTLAFQTRRSLMQFAIGELPKLAPNFRLISDNRLIKLYKPATGPSMYVLGNYLVL